MSIAPPKKPDISRLRAAKRQAVSLSPGQLVKVEPLFHDRSLPLVIRPAVDEVDLTSWATGNRETLETHLATSGAILFRGFDVKSAADFERFVGAYLGELLEYHDRATPRSVVRGRLYTSTDYPSSHGIELHNECSYALTWPLRIAFYCLSPADAGGETPIADCRRVYSNLSPEVREQFTRRGVMYVRNYGEGLGLSWEEAFQTTDRAEAESYCRKNQIEFEWKAGNRLRTRQVRAAVARHQRTGELVWFNQATAFHVSTLEPAVRELLLSEFGESGLSKNVFYGDGSPIEPHVLEQVRAAFAREAVPVAWEKGDVLLLDNMLVAHGRAPFAGPRKILVAMSESFNTQSN